MNRNELTACFLQGFHEPFGVTEEDGAFRLGLPIFFADGDGAEIFVVPEEHGLRVTDRGATWMRLSYRRDMGEPERTTLTALAATHHINLNDGVLSSPIVAPARLAAVAMTLAQVQLSADASILSVPRRAKGHDEVRKEVVSLLSPDFLDRIHVDLVTPDTDPEGLFPLDIVIDGKRPAVIAIATDEASAERAVATQLAHGGMRAKWLCLPRLSKLRVSTQRRLNARHQPLVLDYDSQKFAVRERMVELMREAAE
jgi:Domain of unknown function DUF1828